MNLKSSQKSDLVSFFRVVCNLKKIKRSGWIDKSNISSPESVADHSYSMCMMSMILSEIIDLDTEHIMKMANLHDLAESFVGDNMPDKIYYVHNIDKLEMAIQAKEYEFDGYSKQSLQIFLKSATDYISNDGFDIIFEILQTINDDSKKI